MADLELKNRKVKMRGDYSAEKLSIKGARVVEGMNMLTETTIEFVAKDKTLKLDKMVGKSITITIEDAQEKDRPFTGRCISAEFIGLYQGKGHYIAECRPFLWFLTRGRENRIFQEMSVIDIMKEILGDYGFWTDVDNKTSGTYPKRTYCVQYRESDFDFISRLMEEEGIYYFFTQDGDKEKMVLADAISAHKPTPEAAEIAFNFREAEYRRKDDHIFDWNAVEGQTTGKVTLNDYDFEKPKADQTKSKAMEKGSHGHKSHEFYDYPGHMRENDVGERLTKVKMEAKAVEHVRWRGAGNVRTMGNGQTFKLKDHPRVNDDTEFLIIKATHVLQVENDYEDEETKDNLLDERLEIDEKNKDTYRCLFEVIPKKEPFRAPQTTPWPEIVGLQTAVVTGPSGDEIYTDKYGRIKVQFHWDRLGEKDENTTCWIRCVMPWSGKNWGMISIPRIGQEVVIQFEEGDPDRPICTGMLYNADYMPPYELPANMTQTGIVTRSTKEGSTDTFHELIFEDKKDAEFVRLQSERDYKETIKNNAEITIGLEHTDPGDMIQTVHHHQTEIVKTGDLTVTVEEGNEIRDIATDQNENIGANREQAIGSNSTVDIGSNSDMTVGQNTTIDSGQKITITAGMSIELKVGGTSIKLDASGITMKGPMLKMSADAMAEIKSPMTTVKGDGLLTLKGGLTMIN